VCEIISAQSTKVSRRLLEIEVEGKGKSHADYGRDPFCLVFVYSPHFKRGILFKGWLTEVRKQITKAVAKPYLANFTFWNEGSNRGYWEFKLLVGKVYLDTPIKPRREGYLSLSSVLRSKYNRHHTFTTWDSEKQILLLKLRRIPRRWIPEYDRIVEQVAAFNKEKICVINHA